MVEKTSVMKRAEKGLGPYINYEDERKSSDDAGPVKETSGNKTEASGITDLIRNDRFLYLARNKNVQNDVKKPLDYDYSDQQSDLKLSEFQKNIIDSSFQKILRLDKEKLLDGRNEVPLLELPKLLVASTSTDDSIAQQDQQDHQNQESQQNQPIKKNQAIHGDRPQLFLSSILQRNQRFRSNPGSVDKKTKVKYLDSRKHQLIFKKPLYPFSIKDFNCKLTKVLSFDQFQYHNQLSLSNSDINNQNCFNNEKVDVKFLFIPNKNDLSFYREICDLLYYFIKLDLEPTSIHEFPEILYFYISILMNSFIDPIQDQIISYLINFLKKFKDNNQLTWPAYLQYISRIFNLNLLAHIYPYDSIFLNNLLSNPEISINNHTTISSSISTSIDDNKFSISYYTKTSHNLSDNILKVNINQLSKPIKLAIFNYNQYLKLITPIYHHWKNSFILFKNLSTHKKNMSVFYFYKTFYFKYNKLKKLKFISNKYYNYTLLKFYFSHWHSRFSKIQILNMNSIFHYQLSLKEKFLRFKWIDKYNFYKNVEIEGIELLNLSKKRSYFYKIYQIYKINSAIKKFNHISNSNLQKYYFNNWKSKSEKIRKLNNDVTLIELAIVAGSYYIKWAHKSNQLNTRRKNFVDKKNYNLKLKYFEKLKYHLKLAKIKNKVIHNINLIFKKYYFNEILMKRFQERKILSDYLNKSPLNYNLKKKYFNNWHDSLVLNLAANFYYNKNLKKKIFQQWRLKSIYLQINKYYNFKLLKNYFQVWKTNKSFSMIIRSTNKKILQEKYSIWVNKCTTRLEDNAKALQICNYFKLIRYYNCWYNYFIKLQDDKKKADMIYLKSFLKNRMINNVINKTQELGNNRLIIESKKKFRLKDYYLKIWVLTFRKKMVERLATRKFYIKWKSKSEDLYEMNYYTVMYYNKQLIKDVMFQWYSKSARYQISEFESQKHYNKQLIEKYYNYILSKRENLIELNYRLEEFDFQIIEKYLQKWKLLYLKVRAKNDSFKRLMKTWNKNKLRGLLSLWIARYKERMRDKEEILGDIPGEINGEEINDDDDYGEGNHSPTEDKKNRLKQQFRHVSSNSYHSTPYLNNKIKSISPLKPAIENGLNFMKNTNNNSRSNSNLNNFRPKTPNNTVRFKDISKSLTLTPRSILRQNKKIEGLKNYYRKGNANDSILKAGNSSRTMVNNNSILTNSGFDNVNSPIINDSSINHNIFDRTGASEMTIRNKSNGSLKMNRSFNVTPMIDRNKIFFSRNQNK
ncbi:Sfi1p ASCRUDRAFT_67411 [Ascoidea rubescens DSM 1968]|uniref:Sfi1-domain-containing protein n=1 Tax=Ascoidea rubescens DSM 1968 TaxID=1344418 RepID=A0A1D2VNU9_9ASCO|nr:hypothetical protein ASCRUDRAFT_67411 [Ascoidea rubescens DSM 1968]ODV63291.1 hypothetical protein ASCRUDRAFT_67411 [Ascoidea rubescens DSM 1968]